jgi:hypothetical protein
MKNLWFQYSSLDLDGLWSNMNIFGSCVVDWGENINIRRSTIGFLFMLSNGVITWFNNTRQL